MNKKYFITGGGTGGHIYPAIAVADCLKEKGEVYYVGNPSNLEYSIVKDYPFLPVNITAMPRKVSVDFCLWLFKLGMSVIKCIFYVLKYKPDCVFGTGGYVSAPMLIAAKLFGVPFVMHDCDAKPGLVTRKLAPFASGVSLAFEAAKGFIKNNNVRVNGNPLRAEFKTLTKEQARCNLGLEDKLTVCIMGGSQGARSINEASVEILKTLSKDYNVQVIFQTGKKKFEEAENRLLQIYPNYKDDKNLLVKPYFDNMTDILKSSDIAVSRAGSLSISELCACGIATIFVPYPFAASDHQRKNAKYMEEKDAGIYLEDSDVNPEILLKNIKNLISNESILAKFQDNARNLAKLDSTSDIVKQIEDCV